MDWFLYDRNLRHERAKVTDVSLVSASFHLLEKLCINTFPSRVFFIDSARSSNSLRILSLVSSYNQKKSSFNNFVIQMVIRFQYHDNNKSLGLLVFKLFLIPILRILFLQ